MNGTALNQSCRFFMEKVFELDLELCLHGQRMQDHISYHRKLPQLPNIYLCLLNLAGLVFENETSSPNVDVRSLNFSRLKCNNVNSYILLIVVWIYLVNLYRQGCWLACSLTPLWRTTCTGMIGMVGTWNSGLRRNHGSHLILTGDCKKSRPKISGSFPKRDSTWSM